MVRRNAAACVCAGTGRTARTEEDDPAGLVRKSSREVGESSMRETSVQQGGCDAGDSRQSTETMRMAQENRS